MFAVDIINGHVSGLVVIGCRHKLFQKWYWCGSSSSDDAGDFDDDIQSLVAEDKREYFEKPASNATPGIRIRGLTKVSYRFRET